MKRFYLITFVFLFLILNLKGQRNEKYQLKFDSLLNILKQNKISQSDINNSFIITKELYKLHYTNYFDTVNNSTNYVTHSLTKVFSDICIKFGDSSGVDYYLKYMKFTDGSCEEERSFALERLLVKYPETLLKQVGKNTKLLNDLIWGFVNNRYNGAKNPQEDEDFTAMIVYEKKPKPILNKDNCKKIFFQTNPRLKIKYKKYKYQIDYIINGAIQHFKNP